MGSQLGSFCLVLLVIGVSASGAGLGLASPAGAVPQPQAGAAQVTPTIAAGDITITNFRGPAQAAPGQRVTATATLENTGDTRGEARIEYRIAGQVISTAFFFLEPGETKTVTLQGTVPSLATGTYDQGIFVQDTATGATGTIVIGNPASRFAVLSFQGPSEGRLGDSVTATATIRNTGDAAGTRTFQYRIGDRVVASREVSLNAGQQITLSFQGTVPSLAAGTYTQGVFEGSTANGLTRDFTVPSSETSFILESFSGPSRATAGDTIAATVTVRNTGTSRDSATLRYQIAGTTVASTTVALNPGSVRSVTLSGTVPDRAAGTYTQGVVIGDTGRGLTANLVIDEQPGGFIQISDLSGPSQALTGADVTVTARVTNTGTRTARVPVEYRIGSRVLERRTVELAPGRSTLVTFDVRLPDLNRGVYTQGVFLMNTNRGQTTSLQIRTGAQFGATNLVGPPSSRVGDQVSVRATIRNTGDVRDTRTVEYRLGDRVLARQDLQLGPGEQRTVTLTATVPDVTPGTYRHGVFVDGQGPTTSLTVLPRPQATFSVASFDGPGRTVVGDRLAATATVRNTGDAAGSVTLEYRVNGRTLAVREVALDAGERREVTFDATVPDLPAGDYQQGVFIAGTAQGRTASIRLDAGTARFDVANVQGPAEATVGDQFSVRATITNTGTAAGTTEVQYRLGGEVLATQSVDLAAGQSTTVTFQVTVPDQAARVYQQGVFIGTTNRGQTTSLVVAARTTAEPEPTVSPRLPGFEVPVTLLAMLLTVLIVRRLRP